MRKGVDVAPTLDNTSDEVEPPAEHLDLTSSPDRRSRDAGARPLSLSPHLIG